MTRKEVILVCIIIGAILFLGLLTWGFTEVRWAVWENSPPQRIQLVK